MPATAPSLADPAELRRPVDPAERTAPASISSRSAVEAQAEPSVEVVLPSFVRAMMFHDAFWGTRDDGCEVGGFLFGDRPDYGGRNVQRLIHATETGEVVRTSTSLLLDNGQWKAAEAWVRANEWDDGARGPTSTRCRRCRRDRKLEQRRERHRRAAA